MERIAPDYWRLRAEEARVVACTISDPESQQVMHGIAIAYEHMALAAEQFERRIQALGDPERQCIARGIELGDEGELVRGSDPEETG